MLPRIYLFQKTAVLCALVHCLAERCTPQSRDIWQATTVVTEVHRHNKFIDIDCWIDRH